MESKPLCHSTYGQHINLKESEDRDQDGIGMFSDRKSMVGPVQLDHGTHVVKGRKKSVSYFISH